MYQLRKHCFHTHLAVSVADTLVIIVSQKNPLLILFFGHQEKCIDDHSPKCDICDDVLIFGMTLLLMFNILLISESNHKIFEPSEFDSLDFVSSISFLFLRSYELASS